MRHLAVAACLILMFTATDALGASRFGRKVLQVKDKASYEYVRLDDVDFPYLEDDSAAVSCIVYRGTRRYYVEISVTNKGSRPLDVTGESMDFSKLGYTTFRTNALIAAREAAEAAGVPFVPTPPPDLGTSTKIDLTSVGSGSGYSRVTGSATTGPSPEQTGANLGNALGNLFAARSAAKAQSEEARFSNFLSAFSVDEQRGPIAPRETRVLIATFEQVKDKKAPFSVTVGFGESTFVFAFQELN